MSERWVKLYVYVSNRYPGWLLRCILVDLDCFRAILDHFQASERPKNAWFRPFFGFKSTQKVIFGPPDDLQHRSGPSRFPKGSFWTILRPKNGFVFTFWVIQKSNFKSNLQSNFQWNFGLRDQNARFFTFQGHISTFFASNIGWDHPHHFEWLLECFWTIFRPQKAWKTSHFCPTFTFLVKIQVISCPKNALSSIFCLKEGKMKLPKHSKGINGPFLGLKRPEKCPVFVRPSLF